MKQYNKPWTISYTPKEHLDTVLWRNLEKSLVFIKHTCESFWMLFPTRLHYAEEILSSSIILVGWVPSTTGLSGQVVSAQDFPVTGFMTFPTLTRISVSSCFTGSASGTGDAWKSTISPAVQCWRALWARQNVFFLLKYLLETETQNKPGHPHLNRFLLSCLQPLPHNPLVLDRSKNYCYYVILVTSGYTV